MSRPGEPYLRSQYDMGATYATSGAPAIRPADSGEGHMAELLGVLERPAWWAEASCRTGDAELLDVFFPTGEQSPGEAQANIREAKRICEQCPVRVECESAAKKERHGVWAGESKFRLSRSPRKRSKPRRLSDDEVVEARRMWREDQATIKELSAKFQATEWMVDRALRGESYEHVPDPITDEERRVRRSISGGRNPKLSPAAVREMRRRHREGATNAQLAGLFGVTKRTVSGVVNYRIWQDVPDEEPTS